MAITLYHSPMACSLASKLALVESGLPHEISLVRTYRGENRGAAYLAINPSGRVPALEVDGVVITESVAILGLIADLAPDAALLPADKIGRAKAIALLSYLSSTVHAAFTPSLFPERFTQSDDHEAIRAAALARLREAFLLLEERMVARDFMLERFSVCDLYATVFLLWRSAAPVQGILPTTPRLDALQARVLSRSEHASVVAEDLKQRQGG
jgi:glutathione S-transferase